MGLFLVTAPTREPLSINEAKDQLRIDFSDADDLIEGYILSAREYVESYTRRAIVPQTWDFTIDDEWPYDDDCDTPRIVLPKPPVTAVSYIRYVDSNGVTQTLGTGEYFVSLTEMEGRIEPAYGVTWPTVRDQMNAITVRFTCGYTSTPGAVKMAMRLLVTHWWENQAALDAMPIPLGVDSLLMPLRVFY